MPSDTVLFVTISFLNDVSLGEKKQTLYQRALWNVTVFEIEATAVVDLRSLLDVFILQTFFIKHKIIHSTFIIYVHVS